MISLLLGLGAAALIAAAARAPAETGDPPAPPKTGDPINDGKRARKVERIKAAAFAAGRDAERARVAKEKESQP